jgi:hypothetical protein
VEANNLQQNVDAHGLILKSFKTLLETTKGEVFMVSVKNAKACEAWTSFVTKVDNWRRQKSTLYAQVQCMKNGS